ncbi:MAG TPA: DUF4810 domain-containing protein [Pseudomonas sp.]|nr:DUF4810 domain-containing protein [Pseudomonas sp.]
MKTRIKALGACALLALLAGCGSQPKSLYGWEQYQPQLYSYLKGEGSYEEQIAVLEQGLQKIRARGQTPAPGYHAQLGLLYAQIGRGEQVVQQFRTEAELFPESRPFMEFLLKQKEAGQ